MHRILYGFVLENLTSSDERDRYIKSKWASKCERAARGEDAGSCSRRDVQSHLMLRILLQNFQRPAVVANLSMEEFKQASSVGDCGDRVVTVSLILLVDAVCIMTQGLLRVRTFQHHKVNLLHHWSPIPGCFYQQYRCRKP